MQQSEKSSSHRYLLDHVTLKYQALRYSSDFRKYNMKGNVQLIQDYVIQPYDLKGFVSVFLCGTPPNWKFLP